MIKALVFLLTSLLFCSGISDVQMGMSQLTDHLNPAKEMEYSYDDDKAMENKQAITCGICKSILRKVIQFIGKNSSQEQINQKLDKICQKIPIKGCNTFLKKYKDKLVAALVSGDRASIICTKIKMCKSQAVQ